LIKVKILKTLVIVESPSKADKIQPYLGKDFICLASKGHITELAKGGKYGIGIDIDNNFKPHYVMMSDKIDTLNNLLAASKKCDQVYIASDPDREGEAIAWHIAQRLDGIDKPIKRIVFNRITKAAVLKSLKEVRDIDIKLFHSQEARRILDRLVGFKASPFLMNFIGPKLSAGRVQSVVTRMVIDREREIESFIPEEYFTIQVNLSNDNKNGFIAKYPGRITDQSVANDLKSKFSEKNVEYIVSNVISDEENKSAPPPLITSTLQRIMSRLHSFEADRTMKAAQGLYENGYCTYIRTDSVRVDEEAIKEVREWLAANKYPLPKKENVFKNKDAAQDAHECIRPSDISLLPNDNMAIIDLDEKLVYETIWNHFVASQMTPAVYSTLKVTAHVKDNKNLEVRAYGKALKSKGYLDILGSSDEGKIDIPSLSKGDLLNLYGSMPVKLEKKKTQPPPRFSLDKLIEELVNRNIGRPATYADLLSRITSRNYVEKKGNVFYPTELGKKITDILIKHFTFMDYNYTAKMEEQLDLVENGKLNHIDMLKSFYPSFKSELDKAYIDYGGNICEKCTSPMSTRTAKNGDKFYGCSAYPKCKNTKPI
jgi:DNA topoisomerase I